MNSVCFIVHPHYTPVETKLFITIMLYGLQVKDGGEMERRRFDRKTMPFSVSGECAYFCELVRKCIPRLSARLSD